MTGEFTQCRALGHAWFPVPDDARWRANRVWRYRLVVRCERCGTERFDGIDAFGQVGQRRYAYPEGYAYARSETPSRADFRLAMMRARPKRRRKAS